MSLWQTYIRGFSVYLELERQLSKNTGVAYIDDIKKLKSYAETELGKSSPTDLNQEDIEGFLKVLVEVGLAARSQNRILSGIKAFYNYLKIERIIESSPARLLESAKVGRHLPDTLSHEEILEMLNHINRSHPQGERNKAIIELLYSSGLRVSELTNLQMGQLHLRDGFMIITGKGDKQRLVPIGAAALKQLKIYLKEIRPHIPIKSESEGLVFLNRRGGGISRVMVFNIVKEAAQRAGIKKNISPHILRHSFATELIKGGADLRAVQDMLGHASITTTEIYTHMDQKHLRETLEKFHPGFQTY